MYSFTVGISFYFFIVVTRHNKNNPGINFSSSGVTSLSSDLTIYQSSLWWCRDSNSQPRTPWNSHFVNCATLLAELGCFCHWGWMNGRTDHGLIFHFYFRIYWKVARYSSSSALQSHNINKVIWGKKKEELFSKNM